MRKSFAFKRQCQICQAISIIRRRKWSDRWRAMRAAARTPSRVADPSMCCDWHRRRLSPIAAVVFVGLDQGRRAGGLHQRRNPTPFRDAEIPKPLIWRGLERCRAAGRHRMDAVPVRWRAALVCVFGCFKRSVLRSPRSPSCTAPGDCSPAVTAIGLPMRANRNRHISAGSGNHKRSECGWAEARTCLRSFPTSRKACTGGPMSDGAASMMPPKSDQPLA